MILLLVKYSLFDHQKPLLFQRYFPGNLTSLTPRICYIFCGSAQFFHFKLPRLMGRDTSWMCGTYICLPFASAVAVHSNADIVDIYKLKRRQSECFHRQSQLSLLRFSGLINGAIGWTMALPELLLCWRCSSYRHPLASKGKKNEKNPL